MPTQVSIDDQNGPIPTMKFLVASGAVSTILPGTPTKLNGSRGASGTVVPMVDADGSTSQVFTGICKTASTDTASAAGEVYVFLPLPGIRYAAKAKSATAANTQAKIDALRGGRFVFDLTGTVGYGLTGEWTIDTAAGDGANNCLVVVGGEYQTNTLYFIYQVRGSIMNS